MKSGFLLIDKPIGITSHDVVERLREISKEKKIGHAGTLDPLASGLLILAVGSEATKRLSTLFKYDKEYLATLRLGSISTTFDKEGEITLKKQVKIPSKRHIEKVLKEFEGKIRQVPPIFSAKKIKGERLYKLARMGVSVKPKISEVKIYKILLLEYKFPHLSIQVKCSTGTYIRSLANDIGERLGCGAYLEKLTRTKIGRFSLKDAVKLSQITPKNWMNFIRQLG